MTNRKKNIKLDTLLKTIGQGSLQLELKKSKAGALAVIQGIVSVREYTESKILLATHSGEITVTGQNLNLSLYEDRTIELFGRIEGVEFKYGKN